MDNFIRLFRELKPYDKRICAWTAFAGIFNAFCVLAPLVNHYQPDYHCSYKSIWEGGFENNHSSTQNSSRYEKFKNFVTPTTEKGELSKCLLYERTWKQFLSFEEGSLTIAEVSNKTRKCKDFNYQYKENETSAVQAFNMVCDAENKKSRAVFAYMTGMTSGGIISGYISDKLGRKPVFIFAQLMQFAMFSATGFSPNYTIYVIMTFLYGGFGMVNFYTSVLLGGETTPAKNRNIVCIAAHLGYALGVFLFPLFAYLIRDWRVFCKLGGLFGALYIPLFWIVDESPKWLLSTGKVEKADKLIKKISKINKDHISDTSASLLEKKESKQDKTKNSFSQTFNKIFTNTFLFVRLIVMGLGWCAVNISYYGIALTANSLEGSRFVNGLYAALSETAAYITGFVLVELCGRRNSYILFMGVAGVCVTVSPWIKLYNGTLNTIIVVFGKFLVTSSFYFVYVMTSELFPTAIRHTTSAIVSGFSRIGGMLTSFLIYADPFITAPVIGAFTGCSAVIFLLLPKTHNVPLPKTISDARNMKRGIPKFCHSCQQLNAKTEPCEREDDLVV